MKESSRREEEVKGERRMVEMEEEIRGLRRYDDKEN